MRAEFTHCVLGILEKENQSFFITGDLGYKALEPLQSALGQRFLNAGVAEQNMIGVASGIAKQGLKVWVYSISPFLLYRPFEQIRNNVCEPNLALKLVGNGGGVGYGVMGHTHFAAEDYGTLCCLPSIRCFAPAFTSDIEALTSILNEAAYPSYLRLSKDFSPPNFVAPKYEAWRQLIDASSDKPLIIAFGSLAGMIHSWCEQEKIEASLWVCCEMPLDSNLPRKLIQTASSSAVVLMAEEHIEQGGFAQNLITKLASLRALPQKIVRMNLPRERKHIYGDHEFTLNANGINKEEFLRKLSLVA